MKPRLELPIEQETVTLRELTIEDAPFMFESIASSRRHLSQQHGKLRDATSDKYPTLQSVKDSIIHPSNPDKLRMGIWDGETFVGSIGLTPDGVDSAAAEIGYWLDVRHTGNGYATIATSALAKVAASKFDKVYAKVVDGNKKSEHVLERAGFSLAKSEDDVLIFDFQEREPVLFPSLDGKEQDVAPGDYKLLQGSDEPAQIREGQIHIITEDGQLNSVPLPGIHSRGLYNSGGLSEMQGQNEQIVSFLYNKLGEDGQLETSERAIIFRGIGYGVHPGHTGQPPTWYLVGPQIGTIDHETGQIITMPEEDTEVSAKHFSIACITDGPLGKPILANPPKA